MDAADPDNSDVTQGTNGATIDKMIAHGAKNFSSNDWSSLRKRARDEHQRCIDSECAQSEEDDDTAEDGTEEDMPGQKPGLPKSALDKGAADAGLLRFH